MQSEKTPVMLIHTPLFDQVDALLLLGDVVLAVVVLVALKTRSEKMLML